MRVIVNMACGLANRMFQYSYYLYLKDLGYNACVDYYKTAKLAHERVSWSQIFPKADLHQASAWDVFRTGGGSNLLASVRRRYFNRSCSIVYMPSAFDAFLPDKTDSLVYVIGVFQNAHMVDSIRNKVLAAYSFRDFSDSKNLALVKEVTECESVAIHVRKGKDYMSRSLYSGTCPKDYYCRAVELMYEKLNDPRFYVFADNPDWVKENFTGFSYKLVDWNPVSGYGSHYDMHLMSLCRHNIISNSTYSWWGAYLNRNAKKIVVGPSEWFNPTVCKDYSSDKVLCKDWYSM